MKEIAVLGHIAYDYIFDIPYHPEEGYSIYIKKFSRHYGGGGANICHGIARLGGRCRLFSSIGNDAKRYESYLRKQGVKLALYRSSKKTARAYIFNAPSSQITYFYWGASEDMDKIKDKKTDYLHIAPSEPKVALKMADKAGFIGFEPGQDLPKYGKEELQHMVDKSDIIFCNEYEFKKMRKMVSMNEKTIVVTEGSKGCTLYPDKIKFPAFKVRVVETTGAGDAFKAAFWYGMVSGYTIKECCKLGNAAASFIVRKRGAQHMPEFHTIAELIQ